MEVGGGKEASHPLTAEEEAVKRNTDCVYFLASPLTCKKGNECEYRHSEGARVNPRDCWYWMNGNCLNPKCMFRHPPLEGLYGIPSASSVTPSYNSQSLPSSTQTSTVFAPGAYNPNKQSVPCYYFQKGQCLKGDKCAFMHGPHPAGAHVPQQLSKAPTSLTGPPHALSWSLKECTTQQNIPKLSEDKLVEAPHLSAASVTKAEGAPTGLPLVKSSSPYPVEYELPRSQPHIAPVSSDSTPGRPQHYDSQPVEDQLQNGKDADEFLGESSPGFDVLVDDDIGESEYYHNDDDFGGASVHGSRNPNALNDFDYQHPDYEPVPSFERDQYNGRSDHDQYGRLHNRYGREQCQRSSERILDRISTAERRRQREESTDEMDSSDLRHRLVKQRRLNGSRSVVSPDRRGDSYRRDDRYAEDRYHRSRPSSRDRRHIPQERSSISTRLQGRITLPSRSSPDRSIELRSERDRERGKHRGRISPARPISSQGRHPERIRWRHQEDLTVDGRNIGGQPNKREDWDPLNFAGPKSLAELKGAKVSSGSEEKLTKSLDISKAEHDGLSFEGPKPFSTILKRKRESRSENGSLSSSGDENTERDAGVFGPNSANAACSSEAVSNVVEETKVNAVDEGKEEEGLIPTEGEELLYGQSSGRDVHDEVEEGMVVETEDLELESFDPRDGQSDYEASEGEDYKAEDDENAYQHDNDEELDDEDDFAKKVGIMFS